MNKESFGLDPQLVERAMQLFKTGESIEFDLEGYQTVLPYDAGAAALDALGIDFDYRTDIPKKEALRRTVERRSRQIIDPKK